MPTPIRAAIRLRSVLLPLALGIALADSSTAQDDLKSKSISIADLTEMHAPTPRLPFHGLLGLRHCDYWPSFVPATSEHDLALEPDHLIGMFSMLDDAMDEDGAELRIGSGRLFMRAPPKQLQKWSDAVEIARSYFAAPIRFDAAVLHHDGKMLPPSIVDPEQAQALLSGHKPTWSSSASSPSRMATYMGHHRAVSYLHTNEAEISEARWEATPVQEEAFDGVGLVAVGHRLTENHDLVVQTQFAIGKVLEIVQHDSGLGSQPDPQRPILNVTAASMSGRIKNGGALVFNATAPTELGGNVMVVVRATWAPVKQEVPDNLMIAPVSALTSSTGMTPRFHSSERVALARPGDEDLIDDEDRMPLIDHDELHEMITNTIDPDAWDDTAMLQSVQGHMIFRGESGTLKKVAKLIGEQEQQLLETVEVSYQNKWGRITLPTLTQHGHGVRHGIETTGIASLNTEVAVKASIQVPVVVRLFEGVQFGINPFSAGQDLGARMNWKSTRLDGKPEGTSLPTVQITTRTHTGSIPEGGMKTGSSPLGEETWSLRQR